MIKDVWVGSDAYFKGANKLKNLTIDSAPEAKTQIGEGCEMVNGIVGIGCRIFYGVKAVRFIMASHSQLKYGARLINSYLGNNATISCCEVLNSLIYPFHEQHHNNSFLCAAVVMGQSNMAAGATIGSNHNSRSPDGELIAGRGFWPGLCVSVKHNCRFSSFTMLAKGDYPSEMDIPMPFSLVSMPAAKDELNIMPAYWFMHNMYALARNSWKYADRDKRLDKTQHIELDYLAPDTIHEMENSVALLELFTGLAWFKKEGKEATDTQASRKGRQLMLQGATAIEGLEVLARGFENNKRPVRILKPYKAWQWYSKMVRCYGLRAVLDAVEQSGSLRKARNRFTKSPKLLNFINVGGQLMPVKTLDQLKVQIEKGQLNSWDEVHAFYGAQSAAYAAQKLEHGLAVWEKNGGKPLTQLTNSEFSDMVKEYLDIQTELVNGIESSRAKDYDNAFRNMMYDTIAERDSVLGALKDNAFILLEKKKLAALKRKWTRLLKA